MVFDPYDLSEEVTPEGVAKALGEGNFSAALMMSFRLNEKNLLVSCLETIPITDGKTKSSYCTIASAPAMIALSVLRYIACIHL